VFTRLADSVPALAPLIYLNILHYEPIMAASLDACRNHNVIPARVLQQATAEVMVIVAGATGLGW
jgi:hypothetical protein